MRLLPVLGFVLSGCGSCGSGPAVPFGLDATPGAQADDPRGPADPSVRPNEGRSLPPGTTRVEIEGAPIEDEGSIRALWVHDVDGDGDRDVIAIVDAPVRVLFLRRDGARFGAPRILSQAPTAEGCALTSATFATIGDRLLASAEIGCEGSPADASSERFVLDTDRTPRSLVHLGVLAAEGRADGEVTIGLDADDRDGDGRDDLVVVVRVVREGREASLTLSWLDRPSGLARDSAQPERSLNERSREALRRLRRTPGEALARSRDVLALHEVLCREAGLARVRVGNAPGVACGTSDGAGRAATTIVRAHAVMGETMAALDELARLERPGLLINDERRQYARRALADASATDRVSLREGPTLTSEGTGVRLSALAFVDETHVLLRGSSPRIWDLSSGETTPAEASRGDRRILDPSGRFAVVAIERTCEGHVLRVTSNGAPVPSPLLASVPAPRGASCPLDRARTQDDGGWRVLGWAPQGVLVAHRGELRLVPLDVSARPAGSPSTLGPGTPPPAPLPPGAITSAGRYHVEVRGPGVVLHSVARDAQPELLWPEGWGEGEGEVTDAAVSPSGRRVAVLRGDRVYLLERASD